MADRSDNFNRANSTSTLGSPSDGGAAWIVEGSATWGISSNAGYCVSGSGEQWATLQASVSAVEVQATLGTGNNDSGLCARVVSQTSGFLVAVYDSANEIKLFTLSGTSYVQRGSTYSGAVAAGDVIKIRCDSADLITVSQNGTTRIGPLTQAFNNTATKHGLRCFNSASAGTWDDFSITEIGGGGLTLALSGQAVTVSAGSLTTSRSLPLNGAQATVSAGTVAVNSAVSLSGQSATVSAGSVFPASSKALSGQAVTVSAGALGANLTLSLIGQAVSALAGTLTASSGGNITLALTGQAVSVLAGTLSVGVSKPLVGTSLTTFAGTLSPSSGTALITLKAGSWLRYKKLQ